MTMRVVARSHQARSNTSRRYSSQRRDSPVCNAEPPIMLAQKGFSTSRSRILGTTRTAARATLTARTLGASDERGR